MEIATKIPVTMLPISNPPRASAPRIKPTKIGVKTGIRAGKIISLIADFVTISTHLPYSGFAVPSIKPLISLNWRLTSATTSEAALPTADMA